MIGANGAGKTNTLRTLTVKISNERRDHHEKRALLIPLPGIGKKWGLPSPRRAKVVYSMTGF